MSRKYNKPDLNAPRYRPTKLNLTNQEFLNRFVNDHPRFSHISLNQFKQVIATFNGLIWKNVIAQRDGVELPEQLGYLFIGTCPRRKKESVNYKLSEQYGYRVQNQNWESDNYMAKIFYTNFETKYRFRNHDLWGFTAIRDFKRGVAHTYPKEWKKYLVIDNMTVVSKLFRKQKYKQEKIDETKIRLDNYDEFNLDTPWQDLLSEI